MVSVSLNPLPQPSHHLRHLACARGQYSGHLPPHPQLQPQIFQVCKGEGEEEREQEKEEEEKESRRRRRITNLDAVSFFILNNFFPEKCHVANYVANYILMHMQHKFYVYPVSCYCPLAPSLDWMP